MAFKIWIGLLLLAIALHGAHTVRDGSGKDMALLAVLVGGLVLCLGLIDGWG